MSLFLIDNVTVRMNAAQDLERAIRAAVQQGGGEYATRYAMRYVTEDAMRLAAMWAFTQLVEQRMTQVRKQQASAVAPAAETHAKKPRARKPATEGMAA